MWFKHRAWVPIAWVLSAANVASIWFAAAPGEAWHATIHGLLAVGLGLGAHHLSTRQRLLTANQDLQQALDQNEGMQEALDGMHGQVRELEERVDFAERLLAQHGAAERSREAR